EVKLLELQLESEQIKKASAASKKSAGVRTLSGAGRKAGSAKKDKEEEQDSLVPEYRQTLTLVGVGRDNDNIADYIESLKNCAILTGVELQYIKQTTIESAELRKFELNARIRPGVDARGLVNPDQELDLPEVLAPADLVPSTPIILPPSQMGLDGEPLRPGEANLPPNPIETIGENLDGVRDFGSWFTAITPPNENPQPEVPWDQIPASIDDVEGADENDTDTNTDTDAGAEADTGSDTEDEGEG
ncbi:MAG: PilN domain-containing protein, partial [Planctomycetota bacterium]